MFGFINFNLWYIKGASFLLLFYSKTNASVLQTQNVNEAYPHQPRIYKCEKRTILSECGNIIRKIKKYS